MSNAEMLANHMLVYRLQFPSDPILNTSIMFNIWMILDCQPVDNQYLTCQAADDNVVL